MVRRYFEVAGRWNIFKNPARQIKGRTVTWAEKTTLPVTAQARVIRALRDCVGGAAQMGANAKRYQVLGFDGAVTVAGVLRLLILF